MSQVNEADDPGGRFSVEIFPAVERKKQEAKKKERGGPWKMTPLMEILQNRISTVACKTLRVSHISHRPDGELINDTFQGAGHLKEAGFLSEGWGAPQATVQVRLDSVLVHCHCEGHVA